MTIKISIKLEKDNLKNLEKAGFIRLVNTHEDPFDPTWKYELTEKGIFNINSILKEVV